MEFVLALWYELCPGILMTHEIKLAVILNSGDNNKQIIIFM